MPPNVPKREEAGASGTSLLYASVGSIILVGRGDGLGTLGVLAGVVRAAGSVSNEGIEEDDDELGVAGTAGAGAAVGVGAAAGAGAAVGVGAAGDYFRSFFGHKRKCTKLNSQFFVYEN